MPHRFDRNAAELLKHGLKGVPHTGDPLDITLRKHSFGIEQVELKRRAARVEDQYFHSAGHFHSLTSGISSP